MSRHASAMTSQLHAFGIYLAHFNHSQQLSLHMHTYTARQLCRIPHQCVHFSFHPVEIYVNFVKMPPAIYKRPPLTLTKIHSSPLMLSSPNQFVPKECRFVWLSKRQCVPFVCVTFNCVLSLCINCNWQKVAIMSANILPGILELIIRLSVVGCLRWRYRGTRECHKVASPKSSVVFEETVELSKGRMVISWGWPLQGKTVPLSESWGETGFSYRRESGESWSGGLDVVFLSAWSKDILVTAGYCSIRPARCPRLTNDHCRWCCIWARRHQNCTGLMWYLLMSPGLVFITVTVVPEFDGVLVRD